MPIELGQTIGFPFAGKSMQGKVVEIHPKTVLLRADFPNHKGKLVRRKIHELGDAKTAAKEKGGFFQRIRQRRKDQKAAQQAAAKAEAKRAKSKKPAQSAE